jgi:hypothetical protein
MLKAMEFLHPNQLRINSEDNRQAAALVTIHLVLLNLLNFYRYICRRGYFWKSKVRKAYPDWRESTI